MRGILMSNLYDNRIGDYRNIMGINQFNSPFIIEQVGTDCCREEYEIERKNSPLYVIGYTTNGCGKIIENDKVYYSEKGTLFFLKKNKDHKYFPNNKTWTFSWFNILNDRSSILNLYQIEDVVIFNIPNIQSQFVSAVNQCVNFNNGIADSQLLGQSFILSLMPYLFYSHENRFNLLNSIEEQLKIELEKNCFKDYDIQQICNKLGISVRQAQRIFKSKYLMSPHEYVMKLKIIEARSLILNPQISIKEISSKLGIYDSKYFSVFFKKHIGISPAEFRKLMRL